MKQEAIKDLSADQLYDQLIAERKSYMEMRFQRAAGQLEDSAALRKARRTVARLKTEQRARELKKLEEEGNA